MELIPTPEDLICMKREQSLDHLGQIEEDVVAQLSHVANWRERWSAGPDKIVNPFFCTVAKDRLHLWYPMWPEPGQIQLCLECGATRPGKVEDSIGYQIAKGGL